MTVAPYVRHHKALDRTIATTNQWIRFYWHDYRQARRMGLAHSAVEAKRTLQVLFDIRAAYQR